jgi:hypothetical protein
MRPVGPDTEMDIVTGQSLGWERTHCERCRSETIMNRKEV